MKTQAIHSQVMGWWCPNGTPPLLGSDALERALERVREPLVVVDVGGAIGLARGGTTTLGAEPAPIPGALPVLGYVPALAPESLGDPCFRDAYGVRYAYVGGEMANGIASTDYVLALGRAGAIGFFGAAGLSPERVEQAIDRLESGSGSSRPEHSNASEGRPWGINLIHSPNEPLHEAAIAELYLRRGVRRVCASAYLDLTLPVVKLRTAGIRRDQNGNPVVPRQLIAKVSRVEVARKFLLPPPERFLRELVQRGDLTPDQAALAARLPMADDITAEADSGGHTDNRPAITLIPTMVALRDEIQEQQGYPRAPRIGAAGGIATPSSAAAAFAMGAGYVVTGSINQACVEAATSNLVKEMLAQSTQADVVMAPAADMFEMGVKVQVLKFGTMFALRGKKLYDAYREFPSWEAIPEPVRASIEKDLLRQPFAEAWASTRAFFETRDPRQVERAEQDPKHKLALVFRSYLGLASKWAIQGDASRKVDYQVWCGPAMGAFNEWARGSFLERPEGRSVVPVALNIMVGCAALTRAASLRAQGVPLGPRAQRFVPHTVPELEELLKPRSES